MKISLNWLGLFVDLTTVHSQYDSRKIAHEYSIHTAEIEGVETFWPIDQVLVGKVLTAERHPESTKLSICQVDIGGGVCEQILTWAPNVYAGMFTPVAVVGCQIAPDFVIWERKMAGMISRGMMCGADEIGLSQTSSWGIMDLNPDFDLTYLQSQVGKSFFDLTVPVLWPTGEAVNLPLADTVLEIDNKNITNRPDLFWICGHAREFATVFGAPRLRIDTTAVKDIEQAPSMDVKIETDRVLSYCLAKVEGITNRPSPLGAKILLERSGHSTHDAIVDMTNYLMMELGQPMHAFDADTINGSIIVRQAKSWESLVALDGKTYELTSDDIVIADSGKVLAIAGVMGGIDTGISPTTKNIYIESAVFDPTSIRLTAQRLGLRSEASTRFEKSLDPTFSQEALRRAMQFLNFSNISGMVVGAFEYLDESRVNRMVLALSHDFIEARIGVPLQEAEVLKTLSDLEFAPAVLNGKYEVIVPPHRATKDIRIIEDIVEEIGRIHGYDTIAESPIPGEFAITLRNDWVSLRNAVQNYCIGSGFYEVYNYSFSNLQKDASVLIEETDDAIMIRNAVSQDFTMMRRSMAPLLLQSAHENLKQKDSVKFFEIAKTHRKIAGEMQETKFLAGVTTQSDALKIRTFLDGLFSTLWAPLIVWQGTNLPFLHPNASGAYLLEDVPVGYFGTLHPKVLQNFELPPSTWYFEVDLALLSRAITTYSKYVEPNKYPSISRELNFLLERTKSTGEVARMISEVDSRIHSLSIADVYEHDKIGKDKKSVTFSFVIEDYAKTITDEEAQTLQNTIIQTLEKQSIYLRR